MENQTRIGEENSRIFLSKCSRCGRSQKVLVKGSPYYRRHKCVYCNKNYIIHKNVNDTTIIKEIPLK